MLKAIFAKHVKDGDVILVSGGTRINVDWTDCRGAKIRIGFGQSQVAELNEYDIVGLGYRPGSSASQSNAFLDLLGACRVIVAFYEVRSIQDNAEYERDRDERLTALREALDAYELGKTEKPEGNESLVDRHMTP